MKIKIYSGLTLSEQEVVASLPHAQWAPPIRRGDLVRDLEQGFHIVGIIDGEFLQSLAVTPSEILDALRSGLRMYGAGSMGAMRASELRAHGMIGCGVIYETICRYDYFRDDYLGVVFDGIQGQTSMPMVDFVATAERLVTCSLLSAESASSLMQAYQRLHFTQRHLHVLRSSLAGDCAASKSLLDAVDVMESNAVSQKRLDGLELLSRIAHDVSDVHRMNALLSPSGSNPPSHAHTPSSFSNVRARRLRFPAEMHW